MGNAVNDTTQNDLLSRISSEYEEVRKDTRGLVLLQKQTQNSYILKEYTSCSQIMFQNKVNQLKRQIDQGPKEHVISPVKIESKVLSSFCSTSYKIYAIFEYPQVTLKEEIIARQKEDKSFEQAQLWSILQSCTNALAELKPLVSLNPNQIFINPDGHLKIINDDLVDENYRVIMNEEIYYAPEKMRNFTKIDSELSLRKESIFSMGMTILEAAQLFDVGECYNFKEGHFKQQIMMEMLDNLTERYSLQFLETLGNILEVNPNRRASLMEVQKALDAYWNSEESHQISLYPKSSRKQLMSESERKNQVQQIEDKPLHEKCMNKERVSAQKMPRESQKNRQMGIVIPEKMPSFKLQQPKVEFQQNIIPQTPKNPPSVKENYLYTDPKLLQMIKKDLEDINKLKQSAFYETSRYTFMYPQTQSILNSIKNLQAEPKTNREPIQEFQTIQPLMAQKQETKRSSVPKNIEQLPPTKFMMKKYQSDLVFTIETYQNGRRYEGTMLNGKKHGKGMLMFEDGAYYEGQFKQDKMNGKGILYYNKDFPAYDGEWCDDQFHGYGILYNENPQQLDYEYDFRDMNEVEDYWIKYEGQFALDNKVGKGKLYLTNGQIYEGEFSQDNITGRGKFTCMSGQTFEGIWDGNMLVQVIQAQ